MIQLERLSSCHQWCINYASGIHLVTRQMCSSCLCLCNWIGLFVFFHWCINYASCIQLGDTSNVFFIVCATKLSAAKTWVEQKKVWRSCWISTAAAAAAAGVIAGPTFWNKENFNRVSKLLLFQFFLQLTDQWVTWHKSDFNCSTIGFCYEVKRSGDLFCPLLIILMNDNIFLYGLIMFNKETINAWRQDMLTLWNVKSVQSAGTQTLAQQELVTEK